METKSRLDMVPSEDGLHEIPLTDRTDDLYGTGFFERRLKDYNAQTSWLSMNLSSFLRPESKFPKWLNFAFGYGAENMYGAWENTWETDGITYTVDDDVLPRYRQYYLSLDVDLTRIRSKSPVVRTLLGILNVFKIPAPAVEFNRIDGTKFHWILF